MRVLKASVSVDGQVISAIDKGLLVLLGFGKEDDPSPAAASSAPSSSADSSASSSASQACDEADMNWLATKLTTGNFWPNSEGREWSLTLEQVGGEVLIVSQFTLHGIITKGKRPTFHRSLEPSKAEVLYNRFIEITQSKCKDRRVLGGSFGSMMAVDLVNDGPVTFTIDTKDRNR